MHKMDFIKKRLFLICCILIVLLGVGIFLSGMMVASDNRVERDNIETLYESIPPLTNRIVRDEELTQIEKIARLVENDRDTIYTLAWQTTNRPCIYEEVFPELDNEDFRIFHYAEFGKKYCRLIESFLRDLNAGDSPSDAEEEKKRLEYQESLSGVGSQDYTRQVRDTENIQILLENLRMERSQQIAIYATTDSFCCYDHWKSQPMGDKKTMLLDSWYTQLAAWIQEDVVQAISQINGSSQSVSDSPVKRLIEISFGGAKAASVSPRKSASSTYQKTEKGGAPRHFEGSEYNLPAYVLKSKTERSDSDVLVGEMAPSFTKRACDDLVHVVHFELAVVIDSTKIADFINTLQSEKYTLTPQTDGTLLKQNKRNQITVIQLDIDPIDIEAEKNAGYYYGPASLKVLRIIGEYIFFQKGYQKYIPQPVREIINPPEVATAVSS